eukprot:m.274548 g.274548  ORF g.274548 m.274548 type:complete len:119 (-) comp22857_c1_seq36:20-376(-)
MTGCRALKALFQALRADRLVKGFEEYDRELVDWYARGQSSERPTWIAASTPTTRGEAIDTPITAALQRCFVEVGLAPDACGQFHVEPKVGSKLSQQVLHKIHQRLKQAERQKLAKEAE